MKTDAGIVSVNRGCALEHLTQLVQSACAGLSTLPYPPETACTVRNIVEALGLALQGVDRADTSPTVAGALTGTAHLKMNAVMAQIAAQVGQFPTRDLVAACPDCQGDLDRTVTLAPDTNQHVAIVVCRACGYQHPAVTGPEETV